MAPVATVMRFTLSSAKMAVMMAKPPSSTGTRSGRSPAGEIALMSPALSRQVRNWSSPLGVMSPVPQPFNCRISASARAVPDEPTACCQLPRRIPRR